VNRERRGRGGDRKGMPKRTGKSHKRHSPFRRNTRRLLGPSKLRGSKLERGGRDISGLPSRRRCSLFDPRRDTRRPKGEVPRALSFEMIIEIADFRQEKKRK